jgi:hypothetical protein
LIVRGELGFTCSQVSQAGRRQLLSQENLPPSLNAIFLLEIPLFHHFALGNNQAIETPDRLLQQSFALLDPPFPIV